MTDYHAKYLAYELTRRCSSDSVEKLTSVLATTSILKNAKGEVLRFNGTNADPESKAIYQAWLKKHEGTDKITGSPSSDMRAALVECFRDEASILLATEAAAEGQRNAREQLLDNFEQEVIKKVLNTKDTKKRKGSSFVCFVSCVVNQEAP